MLALYMVAVVVGLALLARAADALVLGCSGIASRFGIPAVVVGVVVIGFGTSAPELLVSGIAAASGSPALGVGTVIGSNIANLTLVLGAAALVAPVAVRAAVVRREAPVSFAATVAFAVAVRAGMTRTAGLALLLLLVLALVVLIRAALADQHPAGVRDDGADHDALADEVEEFLAQQPAHPMRRVYLQAGGGLVGTLLGAQALVWGAVGLARAVSLPEGFIGATVVAVGTSLPELVTAAQASRRGEPDLVVGNLLGSNLFNALAVGGLVALVSGGASVGSGLRSAGLLVMVSAAALAILFMRRRFTVLRWEAATLIAVYVATLPLLAST
jgi:cation:H+ antiporter